MLILELKSSQIKNLVRYTELLTKYPYLDVLSVFFLIKPISFILKSKLWFWYLSRSRIKDPRQILEISDAKTSISIVNSTPSRFIWKSVARSSSSPKKKLDLTTRRFSFTTPQSDFSFENKSKGDVQRPPCIRERSVNEFAIFWKHHSERSREKKTKQMSYVWYTKITASRLENSLAKSTSLGSGLFGLESVHIKLHIHRIHSFFETLITF